ncbi:hypothetical protein NC651_030675 [Populus alba x Populus x berolinensis]|nr:hypothetical protein NC651_030675 [Populus alba x Populus x berolinensis]
MLFGSIYVHARLLPDWCFTTFFMFLCSSKVHAIFHFWCSFLPHSRVLTNWGTAYLWNMLPS